MKRRQRRIAALLLAGMMMCAPVSQVYAESSYDASTGVSAQILFPKDSLTGIVDAVWVNGAETALEQEGVWTNRDDAKVYSATTPGDGTLQISEAGYVLDVTGGVSKKASDGDGGDTSGYHYQFRDEEQADPEHPVDRAYYAVDEIVRLIADSAPEGMEFAGWKCDTEGVTIDDLASADTTLRMVNKKVVVKAEYREIPQTDPPQEEVPQEDPNMGGEVDPNADPDMGGELDPNADPNMSGEADPNVDVNIGGDADPNTDPNMGSDTDPNADVNIGGDADPNADVNIGGDADPNADPNAGGMDDGSNTVDITLPGDGGVDGTGAADGGSDVSGGQEAPFDIQISDSYSSEEPTQTLYQVTVNNGTAAGSAGVSESGYAAGDAITVTALDRTAEGLAFTGWYVDSMNATVPDLLASTTVFEMPAEDVTLTATYQESAPAEYKLTVNNGSSDAESYTAQTRVTVRAADRSAEGFVFTGWTVETGNVQLEDGSAAETAFVMPAEEVILTANYTEQTDTPQGDGTQPDGSQGEGKQPDGSQGDTTQPDGGQDDTAQPDASQDSTIQPNGSQGDTTQPDASQDNTNQGDTTQPNPDGTPDGTVVNPVDAETNAPANADPDAVQTEPAAQKYQVTVENNGIGTGEYAAGENVTVEAPKESADGQVFDSWQTSSGNVALADPTQAVTSFVMPAEAVTVTPTYAAPLYDVTAAEEDQANPKITLSTTEGTGTLALKAEAGKTVTVAAADRSAEGLQFDHWEAEVADTANAVTFADAKAASTTFTMVSQAVTVKAVYTQIPKTYKVTVANGLINNSASELICEENAQITVTANPSPSGQAFAHWTINDGAYNLGDAAYNQTLQLTVTENMNIRAEYEGIQYNVKVENGQSNYATCVSGTSVTVTANDAPEGYEFDYWSVDSQNASLNNVYSAVAAFAMPAADVTLSAHYRQVAYTVYVENGTADDDLYYAGELVTVKSNYPASGRVFNKWEATGDVTFENASRWKTTFTMPAEDVDVRATYKDGPSTNDNVILDLVAGGQYFTGDTIKFTAQGAGMANTNPNPGDYRYRPSGYQIGNVTGTLQSPYSISMAINATGEYTLKVTFNKDIYDGKNWVADGTTDTKSVTFQVVTKAGAVATGDETPLVAVGAIAVISCVIFLLLLVIFLKKRKK